MGYQGAYAGQVSCTFGTIDMGGRNIALSRRVRESDTTTVADSYETRLLTIKSADISVDTPYNTSNTVAEGDKGWLVTEISNAVYIVGTGDCLTITDNIPVGEAVGATYTFKYNGSFWKTP